MYTRFIVIALSFLKKAAFTDPVVVIKSKNGMKKNLDFSFENLYAERCEKEQNKMNKVQKKRKNAN